jgi:hypothetical protein
MMMMMMTVMKTQDETRKLRKKHENSKERIVKI